MIKVTDQTLDQQRRHFDLADDRVAAAAQQSAHPARCVAVIHNQGTSGGVAEEAAAVLRLVHIGRATKDKT